MTTRQPLRHLTLKHMALIKERLGHVAASHPRQFSILPGFFAFSLNFVGVKEEGLLLYDIFYNILSNSEQFFLVLMRF